MRTMYCAVHAAKTPLARPFNGCRPPRRTLLRGHQQSDAWFRPLKCPRSSVIEQTSPRVAVVGCGLSGVAAAETLIRQGFSVCIFDMGENPGGRLAVRDIAGTGTSADSEVVDVGAAFFTTSSDDFSARVMDWIDRDLARAWFDTCTVIEDAGRRRSSGPMRFAATRGTRSLVVDLVEVLSASPRFELRLATKVQQVRSDLADPTRGTASVTIDGERFDAAILAMPDAQALRILTPDCAPLLASQLATSQWQPTISHTMIFQERTWADDDFWFVNNSDVVASIADNGRRRGTSAPVLVAHSTAELAHAHFDSAQDAGPQMTAAVRAILDITTEPILTLTRRWGLAHPTSAREEECGWDADARIAVCGDGWHGKPRMEAAWLSGKSAALKVLAALSQ